MQQAKHDEEEDEDESADEDEDESDDEDEEEEGEDEEDVPLREPAQLCMHVWPDSGLIPHRWN